MQGKSIKAVLSQYETVLSSLEEMGSKGSNTGVKANGLRERFEKGKTLLGLFWALEVIDELKCLNKSLQKWTETIAGMRSAIEWVRSTLQSKRNEKSFFF